MDNHENLYILSQSEVRDNHMSPKQPELTTDDTQLINLLGNDILCREFDNLMNQNPHMRDKLTDLKVTALQQNTNLLEGLEVANDSHSKEIEKAKSQSKHDQKIIEELRARLHHQEQQLTLALKARDNLEQDKNELRQYSSSLVEDLETKGKEVAAQQKIHDMYSEMWIGLQEENKEFLERIRLLKRENSQLLRHIEAKDASHLEIERYREEQSAPVSSANAGELVTSPEVQGMMETINEQNEHLIELEKKNMFYLRYWNRQNALYADYFLDDMLEAVRTLAIADRASNRARSPHDPSLTPLGTSETRHFRLGVISKYSLFSCVTQLKILI